MIIQVIAWIYVALWVCLYVGERNNRHEDSRVESLFVSMVKAAVLGFTSIFALTFIAFLVAAMFGGFAK